MGLIERTEAATKVLREEVESGIFCDADWLTITGKVLAAYGVGPLVDEQPRGAVANAAVLRDTLMEIRDAVEPGTTIYVVADSALIAYARGQSEAEGPVPREWTLRASGDINGGTGQCERSIHATGPELRGIKPVRVREIREGQ